MKDMYSFDITQDAAKSTYTEVQTAYNAFFKEVGVPFVVAEADSGSIGGSLSHEYHYLSHVGEDTVATCDHCKFTANVEKAIAEPPESQRGSESEEAAVEYFVSPDENRETLVAAYYPKNREFSVLHLLNELPDNTIDLDVFENGSPVSVEKSQDQPEDKQENSVKDYAISLFLKLPKHKTTRRYSLVVSSV